MKLSYAAVYIRTHHLLSTGAGTAALKWGSTNGSRRPIGTRNWKQPGTLTRLSRRDGGTGLNGRMHLAFPLPLRGVSLIGLIW